jgi:hypothetical protein
MIAMPAEPPEATRRETWIDWVPPEGREDALLDAEPLLTRDELIAELKKLGVEATPRDFNLWQQRGVIPYPPRQRHKGATRAVYPQWMIGIIAKLRDFQGEGRKLREIGPILRDHVYFMFFPFPKTPRQQEAHDRRVAKSQLFPLWDELDVRIKSLARIRETLHGGHITRAELRLIDDQGKIHITYPFFTHDPKSADDEVDVDGVGNVV